MADTTAQGGGTNLIGLGRKVSLYGFGIAAVILLLGQVVTSFQAAQNVDSVSLIFQQVGGIFGAVAVIAGIASLIAWRVHESAVGMAGLLLVGFWALISFTVALMPLKEPNTPILKFEPRLVVDVEGMPEPLVVNEGIGYPGDLAPDGSTLWLGVGPKGRDMLSRILWGAPRVLFWATLATAVAYLVGMFFGVVAGYYGGWVDEAISFVANILLAFPVMVLYIVIISRLGASGINIVLAVTFASAPGIMRIVRGLVLDIKTRDYIAAAQTRGESPWYIMFIELLPNARGPLVVDSCLRMGYTTIAIGTLGFLGLGLPPPDPDWGKMIAEASELGPNAGHTAIIPAIAIVSLVLGFNLLADGIREISMRD